MDYLEILDELKKVDEVTLLELLGLTSEDIVEKFSDEITENLNRVYKYFGDEQDV